MGTHPSHPSEPKKLGGSRCLSLSATTTMAPTPTDNAAHSTILSDSLRRLQLKEQVRSSLVEPTKRADLKLSTQLLDVPHPRGDEDSTDTTKDPQSTTPNHSPHPHVHEGYGFRPASGVSTPVSVGGTSSPLPDPNGLGWPGAPHIRFLRPMQASKTLSKPSPPWRVSMPRPRSVPRGRRLLSSASRL